MVRTLNGVLTRSSEGLTLFNHKAEYNLTRLLDRIWWSGNPVHITISNNEEVLLDENGEDVYKNNKNKYHYCINDKDISQTLIDQINNLIYITIREESLDGQQTATS